MYLKSIPAYHAQWTKAQTSQVSQQSDPLRPCHWHDHCAMGVATVPLDGSGTFDGAIPLWAWPLRYRHDSWDLEHSAAHDSVDQEPAASPSALALSARRRQISAMLASVGSAEGPAVQPLRSHPQSLAHQGIQWKVNETQRRISRNIFSRGNVCFLFDQSNNLVSENIDVTKSWQNHTPHVTWLDSMIYVHNEDIDLSPSTAIDSWAYSTDPQTFA